MEDLGARRGSVGADGKLTATGVCGVPYGRWLDGRTAALSGVDSVTCGAGDGILTDDRPVQPAVQPTPGVVTVRAEVPQLADDGVARLAPRLQYDPAGEDNCMPTSDDLYAGVEHEGYDEELGRGSCRDRSYGGSRPANRIRDTSDDDPDSVALDVEAAGSNLPCSCSRRHESWSKMLVRDNSDLT